MLPLQPIYLPSSSFRGDVSILSVIVTVVCTVIVLVVGRVGSTAHAGLLVDVLASHAMVAHSFMGHAVVAHSSVCNTVVHDAIVCDAVVHGAVVGVARLSVLVVGHAVVADGSAFSVVALANLLRSGVLGQGVTIGSAASSTAALIEHAHELVATTVAGGVVVGRAGTEALLLSAVTDQHKLKQHRQQEEEDSDDGDSQAGSLHLASLSIGWQVGEATVAASDLVASVARAERSVDPALARAGSVLVGNRNVDEGADEAEIQDDGNKGRKRVTGETA